MTPILSPPPPRLPAVPRISVRQLMCIKDRAFLPLSSFFPLLHFFLSLLLLIYYYYLFVIIIIVCAFCLVICFVFLGLVPTLFRAWCAGQGIGVTSLPGKTLCPRTRSHTYGTN